MSILIRSFSSPAFWLSLALSLSGGISSSSSSNESTASLPSPHHNHRIQGIVPAMFVFGDSIVDNGNNVFLTADTEGSGLNVKYRPYGIDFPLGSTGRFTNGRNPSDWLSALLHFPHFLPAAKDPQAKGFNVMNGLNYASGGSGIGDDTCKGACVPLAQQIHHFKKQTLPDLLDQLKSNHNITPSSFLAKSLFVFNTGGNDCARNCYQPGGNCSSVQVITPLVGKLIEQIKTLHELGARKFVLFGVQAIGCTPAARRTLMTDGQEAAGCVEQMNQAAIAFNSMLNSSLVSLQTQLSGSNFVFVDTYSIVRSVYDNPESLKIRVTNETCCTVSSQGNTCTQGANPCQARHTYLYFDALHFTGIFYSHLAATAFLSHNTKEIYPGNIRQLVSL